eukprot:1976919-Ditylum_brightwellii.AAC.1
MGHNYVGKLRWGILGEGNYEGDTGIVQFATEKRGAASESYPDRSILSPIQQLIIVAHVDDEHAKGATMTNAKL